MLATSSGNVAKVVYCELIGRMRAHVQLADTEIHRVGTSLYRCNEALSRAYRRHYFKFSYFVIIHLLSFAFAKLRKNGIFVPHEQNYSHTSGVGHAMLMHLEKRAKGYHEAA